MTLITVLDVIARVAVVFYAGDALRAVAAHREPLRAISFALVTIGAFGGLCSALQFGADWSDAALSMGVAYYCARYHRRDMHQPGLRPSP